MNRLAMSLVIAGLLVSGSLIIAVDMPRLFGMPVLFSCRACFCVRPFGLACVGHVPQNKIELFCGTPLVVWSAGRCGRPDYLNWLTNGLLGAYGVALGSLASSLR